jgi:DNA-binding XRE family transcriptional regulator
VLHYAIYACYDNVYLEKNKRKGLKMKGNKFLKKRLRAEQMSQVDLARKTGIKQQTISRLVNGVTKHPSRDTALRLANFFQVSTDEIYQQ